MCTLDSETLRKIWDAPCSHGPWDLTMGPTLRIFIVEFTLRAVAMLRRPVCITLIIESKNLKVYVQIYRR